MIFLTIMDEPNIFQSNLHQTLLGFCAWKITPHRRTNVKSIGNPMIHSKKALCVWYAGRDSHFQKWAVYFQNLFTLQYLMEAADISFGICSRYMVSGMSCSSTRCSKASTQIPSQSSVHIYCVILDRHLCPVLWASFIEPMESNPARPLFTIESDFFHAGMTASCLHKRYTKISKNVLSIS